MQVSRRQFLKVVGITLAAYGAGRTVYAGARTLTPRGKLRSCWLAMAEIERELWSAQGLTQDAIVHMEMFYLREGQLPRTLVHLTQETRDRLEWLYRTHKEALRALVAEGELDSAVADEIDTAFRASICENAGSLRPCREASCYVRLKPPFWQRTISELARQAELLAKEAWVWPLDPEIVALAQANVEREIAELTYSPETEQALVFLTDVLLQP